MTGWTDRIPELLGAFAERDHRRDAAASLARSLGCDALTIFAPDPELDVLLPAPGLPQTLRHAPAWQAFLVRCRAEGQVVGELPSPDGAPTPARAVAADGGVVAVLTGGAAAAADLAVLRAALPLLGALFRSERRAEVAAVRVAAAGEAVARAGALSETLRTMSVQLEIAVHDAEVARAEARQHADEAEAFAAELQAQALQLEDQTSALELLNTELAARTDEAEVARAAADTANRTKSDYLATMSHELRTPINAIIGYTELLEMEISGPVTAEQRTQLERVGVSSRHLLTLINDVLDLAKIEAGHMTIARRIESADRAAADAMGLLKLQASQGGISVVYDCAANGASYVGDEDRVRQIVANLLSNAIKFTDPGGTVTVRCGNAEQPPTGARISGERSWTYIQVEDTGIGMAPEDLEAVFRPFVQAEAGHVRARGGTGLGLTISRHLARLMGGDLTARSEPGRGSCFTLWLAAAADADADRAPTQERPLDVGT